MISAFHFPAAFLLFHAQLRFSAYALSIPKELHSENALWQPDTFDPLVNRDTSTCGGDSSLFQCGGSFPSNFCCAAQTTCLQLNTSMSIVAALCCPAGHDCSTINTISCDQDLQNATTYPSSQLHASPPTQLSTCGTACCPMGYVCSGGSCKASAATNSAGASSSSATISASTASPTPSIVTSSATPTPTNVTSSATSTSTAVISISASAGSTGQSSSSKASADGFSSKSFTAGFVPGIAIGVLVTLGALFFVSRRRQRKSNSYLNEKHDPTRDTLTDLGPELYHRPMMHGRSISEPTVDPNLGHRTEFLQFTPPSNATAGRTPVSTDYSAQDHSPTPDPASTTTHVKRHPSKVRALFSRSPFLDQAPSPVLTQAPLPDHLKRGTLSYPIAPVRGLRKQRSMHSLRRQLTNGTAKSASTHRQPQPPSRTGSTETIQVLMQSPPNGPYFADSRPQPDREHHPCNSSDSWESRESEDTTPIEDEPLGNAPATTACVRQPVTNSTPTRAGRNNRGDIGATLGTPYTPSNFHRNDSQGAGRRDASDRLAVEREKAKRDTTFSAMMERAGFRQEDLLMSGAISANVKVQRRR